MNSIEKIKFHFHKELSSGRMIKCVVCEQSAKIYKRPLYSSQSFCLIEMYKKWLSGVHLVHVKDLKGDAARGGDFAKMELWGLISQVNKSPSDTKKRTSGCWSITKKGIAFAAGRIKIPKKVVIYNKKVVGFSEEQISIKDSINDNFDYEELMKNGP